MGDRREFQAKTCQVTGCARSVLALGFCNAHYKRLKKHGDPLAGGPSLPRNEAQKFYRDIVIPYEGQDCLTWPFGHNKGYGTITLNGKKRYVSRLVCEIEHGPPPTDEHEAAHTCGKGRLGCVAKKHLVWKTSAENKADTLAHGTRNRGIRHGASKLTEADILAIRSERGKTSQRDLSERFGVSRGAIRLVQSGTNWGWL